MVFCRPSAVHVRCRRRRKLGTHQARCRGANVRDELLLGAGSRARVGLDHAGLVGDALLAGEVLRFGGAFGSLDVLFHDAAHTLKFGTHVGADAVQLDRVAEAHLALGVHEAVAHKLGAQAGSLGSNLSTVGEGTGPRGDTARLTWSRRFLYSPGE